ncbi:hypothetical protein ACL07V_03625 [Streptomyces sp. MB22_4]|uniref:hypothetical protein n=1 Tax=unclassified Streptomyces TaxID=2593676 RepID=UPI0024A14928|nr:hypothetical protein [Streptomyces hygroscopicus]GLX47101.1 hypothetical protein Shyhy01_00510 [Streptomyces hygroscopicus subsp. hygroscopicus]
MPAVESGLVDLSGVSLEALRSLDGGAFTESLENLLHHIDGPQAIAVSYGGPGGSRLD